MGICSSVMANVVFFGGFYLGFAIAVLVLIGICGVYLRVLGRKTGPYSTALLVLSAIIAAGFARSDDGFVKFVMVLFLFGGVGSALCLQSGKNRRDPGTFGALAEPLRTILGYGFGRWDKTIGGLICAVRSSGKGGKKAGGVLLGLLIAAPILAIMLTLLISADAAFAGLMELLPEFQFGEAVVTVLFGSLLACILVSYLISLGHGPAAPMAASKRKGANPLTVNTVLAAVSLVYFVYLVSQLAYFVGGFAGILPEGFTMAEYARRGFFEMGGLCASNLAVMAFSMGLVKKEPKVPVVSRLLCLFIGLVTLFFVFSASAKMVMYIQSYGMTRLRLLTEVIMVFLGVVTVFVCIWLFLPKLPYMKAVMLTALLFGAVVIWADVDSVVARYNVTAYQAGLLETVDVEYLRTLNSSTVPYLEMLTRDSDPLVAKEASVQLDIFKDVKWDPIEDFRDWNWADWIAEKLLAKE